jgi:hypothetical protein
MPRLSRILRFTQDDPLGPAPFFHHGAFIGHGLNGHSSAFHRMPPRIIRLTVLDWEGKEILGVS